MQKLRAMTAVCLIAGIGMVASMASAATYNICVQYAEIDGGPFGAYDGAPDKIYDFGDGTLGGGDWNHPFLNQGTIDDTDGSCLRLKSPGEPFNFPGIPETLERTEVVHLNQLSESQLWRIEVHFTVVPAVDLTVGANVAVNLISQSDIVSAGVINYVNPDAATLGLVEGLAVYHGHSNTGFSGLLPLSSTSITEATISGDVVIVLDHSAAGEIDISVSTDGGSTFFDRGTHALTTGDSYRVFIYTDPYENTPEPTPVPTCPEPTPTPTPADSYTCYKAKDKKNPPYIKQMFNLSDQFGAQTGETKKLFVICAPTSVDGGGIQNHQLHLCGHRLKGVKLNPQPLVEVVGLNTGTSQVEIGKPFLFLDPCDKNILP